MRKILIIFSSLFLASNAFADVKSTGVPGNTPTLSGSFTGGHCLQYGSGVNQIVDAGSACGGGGGGSSNIGTSLTAASPQISGDATSGLYTLNPAQVGMALSGAPVMQWESAASSSSYVDVIPGGSGSSSGTEVSLSALSYGNIDGNLDFNINGLGIGQLKFNSFPALWVDGDENLVLGQNDQIKGSGSMNNIAIMTGNGTINQPVYGNIFMGNGTGSNIQSGSYNFFAGNGAAPGNGSVQGTASSNVGIGNAVFYSIDQGYLNNAIGYETLPLLTSGSSNIGIGYVAGISIVSGAHNIVLGDMADVPGNVDQDYGLDINNGIFGISLAGGVGVQKIGFGEQYPQTAFDIADSSMRIEVPSTPSSSSAACAQGAIQWDANFIYVCVNTNTWARSALTPF